MKKLLLAFALTITLSLSLGARAFAATRYWDVQIMTPSVSSSNHTLNVAYNVLSTEADDVYDVSLYQNEVLVGSQHVDHPPKGGDSGVFNITMPANGAYNYQISANNTSAGEVKMTTVKSVQIVDGPTPNVVTITNPAAQATTASSNASSNGSNSSAATGTVEGASTGTGQVSNDGAAKTGTKQTGSALGAETTKKVANNSHKTMWAVIIAALAVAGFGGYRVFLKLRED